MRCRATHGLVTLLTVALALAGGCEEEHEIAAQPQGSTAVAPPPEAARPPRPAPAPTPAPGEAMVRMALPTGDFSTSVLSLEKSAPKEVLVGKEFAYTIRLANLTATALKGVVLTGKLSDNVKLAGTEPEGTIKGSHVTWDVGTLGPKETKTFVMRGLAKATGVLIGCSEVTFDVPEVCLSIRAVQPALKLQKTMPPTALLCENIPAKIVVTNTGTGNAERVVVQDNFPAGMTTLDGKAAVAYDVGTLRPGESREIAVQAKASKTGSFNNRVTATAAGGLTAEDSATTVVRVPELAIDYAGPKTRYVGRTATYVITVTNKGDADARETVLVSTIPAGMTLAGASEGALSSAGKVTWKLDTIKAGASKKVSLALKAVQQGVARSTAAVTAFCSKASGEAVTVVKGIPAILLECVDLEDPIEVGANETYVIVVTNQGSAVGTNIVVTCTLPDEQEFVSATGPTKETTKAKTVAFAPLATLAPKAKATYRVVVKGLKAGDVRFKVTLNSDQMTSPAGETESTHIYAD